RVAGRTMGKALHQVGTAIELAGEHRIRPEFPDLEKHELPTGNQTAHRERKWENIGWPIGPDRLACHQEGVDCLQVCPRYLGEMIVGKCRIEMRSVAPHTLAHCAPKSRLRPPSDPGIGVS